LPRIALFIYLNIYRTTNMGCGASKIPKGYGYVSSKEAKAQAGKEPVDWRDGFKGASQNRGNAATAHQSGASM